MFALYVSLYLRENTVNLLRTSLHDVAERLRRGGAHAGHLWTICVCMYIYIYIYIYTYIYMYTGPRILGCEVLV